MSENLVSRKRKLPPSILSSKAMGVTRNDDADKKLKRKQELPNSSVNCTDENKHIIKSFPTNMKNPISLSIPSQTPVKYCTTAEECAQCCITIQRYIDSKPDQLIICGLDAEWNASYKAGVRNPVALLQICIDGKFTCLFHLIHFNASYSQFQPQSFVPVLPNELVTLLKNPNIIKVGLNVKGDITRLEKDFASQLVIKVQQPPLVSTAQPSNTRTSPGVVSVPVSESGFTRTGLDSPTAILLNIPIDASPCDDFQSSLNWGHSVNSSYNVGTPPDNKATSSSVSSERDKICSTIDQCAVKGVCDLRNIAKALEFACNQDTKRGHIVWPTKGSLGDVVYKLSCYGNTPLTIPKPSQIRCGNWEFKPLGREQLIYAALDAYASWFAFQQMKELYLSPTATVSTQKSTQLLVSEVESLTTTSSSIDIIPIDVELENFDKIIRNCVNQDINNR